MKARLVTNPPPGGRPLALYDGHCRFCTAQAKKLEAAARGRIAVRSFQDDGVLALFPGLTHEECMRELKLVDADGRVYGGAAAVVRALRLGRPIAGRLAAAAYRIPGAGWIAERAYAWIARRRYRLFGKTGAGGAGAAAEGPCGGAACEVHFGK